MVRRNMVEEADTSAALDGTRRPNNSSQGPSGEIFRM